MSQSEAQSEVPQVALSKKQKIALGLITKQPQSEAQIARNQKSAAVLKAYQADKKAKKQIELNAKSEDFQESTGVKVVEKPKRWVRNPTIVPGRPPGGREFIKAGDGVLHGPDGPPQRPMQPSAAMVACEDSGLSFSDYMAARDEWQAWRESKPKYTPPKTFIGESITASYKGKPDPKVARRASGLANEVDESDDEAIDDTRIQRKVKKVAKTVTALSKLDSKIAQLAQRPVDNPYLTMMMGRK